jgi:hypothetical protein
MLGGQIQKSFDWVAAGQSLFGPQSGSFSLNSLASDDAAGTALTSVTTDQGILTGSSSAVGFGFRMRAPATAGGTRTLRIYGSVFSAAVSLSARLNDGSATLACDTGDQACETVDVGGSRGYAPFEWTITYQSARDGADLEVGVVVTKNYGSTPNVKFTAATLQ